METIEQLKQSKTIFWDFDGVIKDSVTVKSDSFEQLFLPYGKEIAAKVRSHHEANGGISRFDKLPIYLKWAGQILTIELIEEYAKKFSQLVKQKVIDSEWVPGIIDYLDKNYTCQKFYIITATPQQEIEEILLALKINQYFKDVIGSPTKKDEAVKQLLYKYKVLVKETVMLGDSNSDYSAAEENEIYFILRRTDLNKKLQQQLNCQMIDDFL